MTNCSEKRPSTTCIQVWHANGALKNSALRMHRIRNEVPRDIKRFKRVYASFDYIVTGSDPYT
ncbi:CDP-glycerol glycerophosphotransferase family protein [Bacillus sp. SL00103]